MSADRTIPLIGVEDLQVHFSASRGFLRRRKKPIRAVNGVNFEIHRGETFGLVGESGCGKTTTGRAILQVTRPTSGRITLEGADLTHLKGEALRQTRRRMQMIFQDPYASLNPRMRVGRIAGEPLEVFRLLRGDQLRKRVRELFDLVGLPPAAIERYPHQLSSGQRQRVGIARALALQPDFVVCDEPVAALDVSIQAQVINLLADLQKQFGLTYLLIAHDLGVVRHTCDRVAVMYLGKIVELATRAEIYGSPEHPYTQALLSAIPVPDPEASLRHRRPVPEGNVANAANPLGGCAFRARCPVAEEICRTNEPELRELSRGHLVSCHLVQETSITGS